MRNKKQLETELRSMQEKIASMTKGAELDKAVMDKAKAEDTSANLLQLYKIVMENNRQTQMAIRQLSNNVASLSNEIHGELDEVAYQSDAYTEAQDQAREDLPISGLDARILQFIQTREKEMACADDIKSMMNYRGRNAASARLNRLCRQGLLRRYQLGHRVYYKFDAGKATNLLIVSPPQ